MNKSESKYFNTARKMDEALITLLEKKDLEYITVREICRLSQVNRSTFYLHYEGIADLLDECLEYVNQRFESYFEIDFSKMAEQIDSCPVEKLNFITPEYINPYLKYVKENKKIYYTQVTHPERLKASGWFEKLKKYILLPVMRRFGISEDECAYWAAFSVNGVAAIVSEWVKNGCAEPEEKICGIIIKCVRPIAPGEKNV